MKTIKTYTPDCGEDITTCIENSLRLSVKYQTEVQFTFNGLTLKVNHLCDTVKSLLTKWETLCKESRESYKDSPEYKLQQENLRLGLVKSQNRLDFLVESLYEDMSNHNLLLWLIDFTKEADHSGTVYDENKVLNILNKMGFEESSWVGYDGDWSFAQRLEYIVGQVINCLNTFGTPHPSIITFCEELLGEYHVQ